MEQARNGGINPADCEINVLCTLSGVNWVTWDITSIAFFSN